MEKNNKNNGRLVKGALLALLAMSAVTMMPASDAGKAAAAYSYYTVAVSHTSAPDIVVDTIIVRVPRGDTVACEAVASPGGKVCQVSPIGPIPVPGPGPGPIGDEIKEIYGCAAQAVASPGGEVCQVSPVGPIPVPGPGPGPIGDDAGNRKMMTILSASLDNL